MTRAAPMTDAPRDREIDDLFVFVQLILIEGLRFGRLDCSSKVVGEWRRLDCSGRLWDSCQNINKLQTLHLHPHSFNQSKFGAIITIITPTP